MTEGAAQHPIKRGLVKQVLSGDSIVLQGPPTNGPPKEITIYLANAAAPRLAKRPTDSSSGTSDEPYAWEAREFLRKKIVGKTVVFIRDFIATSGREHGRIYLGGTGPEDAENITESGVREGWLEVKPGKVVDESTQKLLDLQQQAKSEKKGRWAEDGASHVRDITWNIEDPRALVDKYAHQPVDAVVEQVRDGHSVRAFLLPSFEYVTVMLSGIKAPSPSRDGRSEEYGDEAKFFVETRLLQRDVKITLEGVSGQNFIGSVVHPRGNIAEFLLKDGYAKCVEWSLNQVDPAVKQKLRDAERYAKEHKLRLWKSYVGNALSSGDRKAFNAKVLEVGLGDSITIQKENGSESKIYFSSIRAPRRENAADGPSSATATGKAFRPLYDIPYMFQAREFLRKALVGKKVQVTLDYVQPKSDQFPEKECCTVTINGQNIAEQLVENGLAKAVRHRQDDENRSPHYDALLAAESNAEKAKKGMWNPDNKGTIRIQELQGDAARSRQFLPHLQRSTRLDGVVEFVAGGSRVRIYIPKESCVITFLLGFINCPRGARLGPGGKLLGENEPYAEEALNFTKSHVLQHDVQIEVEGMDKAGGFIGSLFYKSDKGWSNLAEQLIQNGLATVHFTADKSRYYNQFLAAEEHAKKARLNLWKDYAEEEEIAKQAATNEPTERKLNLKKVLASAVYKGNLHFTAQNFSDGPAIEALMNDLQRELANTSNPSYKPRRGELCACFDEHIKLWHRAKVESVRADRADVLYVDFGNRENVPLTALAPLPPALTTKPPLCHEYKLALVQLPNKTDFAAETDSVFEQILLNSPYLEINTEYKADGKVEAVSVFSPGEGGEKIDVGKYMVENGLALAEPRRESRFKELVEEYQKAERSAKMNRLSIWMYGDFTGTEF